MCIKQVAGNQPLDRFGDVILHHQQWTPAFEYGYSEQVEIQSMYKLVRLKHTESANMFKTTNRFGEDAAR